MILRTSLPSRVLPFLEERSNQRLVSSSWTWGPTAKVPTPCLAGHFPWLLPSFSAFPKGGKQGDMKCNCRLRGRLSHSPNPKSHPQEGRCDAHLEGRRAEQDCQSQENTQDEGKVQADHVGRKEILPKTHLWPDSRKSWVMLAGTQ